MENMVNHNCPNDLIYFVTDKCNLKCDTCFYWKELNSCKSELKKNEIMKVSSSLDKIDSLYLSGGEPFLREDLANICHIFYKQNNIESIHLPTNGTMSKRISKITKSILKKCNGTKLNIALPLDGLRETHNHIKNKAGHFDKVLNTVSDLIYLKKEFPNLSTYVSTVVCNKNLHEVKGLAKFVKTHLELDYHGISPIRGSPRDSSLKSPSPLQWYNLYKYFSKYDLYYAFKTQSNAAKAYYFYSQNRYVGLLIYKVLNKTIRLRCPAGTNMGVLGPEGSVRLCETTNSIGNVRDYNYQFPDAWHSAKANEMRNQIKDCMCTHPCFLWSNIKNNIFYNLSSVLCGWLN